MLQIHRKGDSAPAFIPDFGDPLGLLVHCHVKIDGRLKALERAAAVFQANDVERIPEAFEAIAAAQAHFAGPGAKHTADEEESLFPRLRALRNDGETGVLEALDELVLQHRIIERAHAVLDGIVEELNASGTPSPSLAVRFEGSVAELVALYRPHIRLEEEFVFPAAARLLAASELVALGGEMRARRR